MIKEKNLFSVNDICLRLNDFFKNNNVRSAILFGSYAQNNARQNSDIDILVDCDLRGLAFVGFIEELRELLDDKEVDIINKYEVIPDSLVEKEIMKTGVKIYG